MSDRVKLKQDATGQWWLSFVRYHKLYWRQTGTTDRAEAEDMAAEVEASLVAEQRRKMVERAGWRPAGLEPPTTENGRVQTVKHDAPTSSTGVFNSPRIVRR